jgi:hypothetical protein
MKNRIVVAFNAKTELKEKNFSMDFKNQDDRSFTSIIRLYSFKYSYKRV